LNGILKSYSKEKEYGFIKGEDNNDYFFHITSFKNTQDRDKLCTGITLSFDQKVTPKGYSAINIIIDNKIQIGYITPDTVYTSKNGEVKGWEIVETSKWVIYGSSRYSPDDAKDLMLHRANNIGANCILYMEYFKTTGSEPGTGKGTYYYTIHNFRGRAVNIAKKSPNGKFQLNDFSGLNDRAKELKKQLIIKTTNSTHTKMTIWAVVLLIVFISWLINNQSGIIVSVFSFILGWRFIYSTDYDSWLEEV
jgi:cold shock CspA family protein